MRLDVALGGGPADQHQRAALLAPPTGLGTGRDDTRRGPGQVGGGVPRLADRAAVEQQHQAGHLVEGHHRPAGRGDLVRQARPQRLGLRGEGLVDLELARGPGGERRRGEGVGVHPVGEVQEPVDGHPAAQPGRQDGGGDRGRAVGGVAAQRADRHPRQRHHPQREAVDCHVVQRVAGAEAVRGGEEHQGDGGRDQGQSLASPGPLRGLLAPQPGGQHPEQPADRSGEREGDERDGVGRHVAGAAVGGGLPPLDPERERRRDQGERAQALDAGQLDDGEHEHRDSAASQPACTRSRVVCR